MLSVYVRGEGRRGEERGQEPNHTMARTPDPL